MNILAGKVAPVLFIPLITFTVSVQAASCESVVSEITRWYNNTPSACGNDPAVDCSGVMMRATHRWDEAGARQPQRYDVWNPSPASQTSGGVSVSWMRSDRIGYEDPGLNANNGIIFTPRQFVERPLSKLDVYCAYPIDAWTDYRAERGCGDNRQTSNVEKSCQALGINDLNGWKQHYEALGGSSDRQVRHKRQCAFSMRGSMSRTERRDAFEQFIKARKSIAGRTEGRQVQTELRVVTWGADKAPVAAFFYSEARGRKDAMKNQFDYYQKTGRWVPTVKMDFPKNADSKARFACEATAQHKDLPRPVKVSAKSCDGFIQTAKWIQRDDPKLGKGVWTLSVTPTDCGRRIKSDQTDAMYAELVRNYGADPRWSGAKYGGGMRRQLVCHLTHVSKGQEVRYKPVYNLEPSRPDVSHDQSLAQGCNPYPAVPYL